METQGWTQWKEQIESLLEQGPQRAEPIAQALQVPQDEVLPVLEAMVEEGRLVKTRKERYARPAARRTSSSRPTAWAARCTGTRSLRA